MFIFVFFLQARHDHNKIAPRGMIKVFWIWTTLLSLLELRNAALATDIPVLR